MWRLSSNRCVVGRCDIQRTVVWWSFCRPKKVLLFCRLKEVLCGHHFCRPKERCVVGRLVVQETVVSFVVLLSNGAFCGRRVIV